MWYWKGELKWSVKEAKEVGLVKQSLLQCNMLYSAATAPLQFAIRPSLMSCYYWGPHRRNIIPFIAGSLQHLLHYFPVGLSVLQFSPSVLCSTVVSVKKDGRQVINFTSFEKEFSLSDGSFCRKKRVSPCFVLNLWNISAMCCGICQLMRCQQSRMENRERIKILFTYEIAISSNSTKLVKWICLREGIPTLAAVISYAHWKSFLSLYLMSHFLK